MKNTLVIFRLLFLLFAISAVYWIISIVQSDAPSKKDTAAIISAFVFGFYHVISALSEWRKLRAEND